MIKLGRQRTIKISIDEFQRLTKAKKKLEKDLGADLALGSAIALLAGVFLGTIATAKKNKQYLTCQCNNIIDVSGLPDTLRCPRCGLTYTRTDQKVKTH